MCSTEMKRPIWTNELLVDIFIGKLTSAVGIWKMCLVNLCKGYPSNKRPKNVSSEANTFQIKQAISNGFALKFNEIYGKTWTWRKKKSNYSNDPGSRTTYCHITIMVLYLNGNCDVSFHLLRIGEICHLAMSIIWLFISTVSQPQIISEWCVNLGY